MGRKRYAPVTLQLFTFGALIGTVYCEDGHVLNNNKRHLGFRSYAKAVKVKLWS